MNDIDYRIILGELVEIKKRLDSIEQASTLRANSEQSVVARPDEGDSENPALARPATLAKLKAIMKEELADYTRIAGDVTVAQYLSSFVTQVLQRMSELDQGPIAKCLSEQQTLDQELLELHERNQQ